ncbi:MAG: hypothetical protein ACK5RQ_01290 [Bacteroidota bacterium]
MPRKEQLQPMFTRLLAGLASTTNNEIRIVFDAGHPLREKMDLLLYVGETLMAMGSWCHRITGRGPVGNDEKIAGQRSQLMALETIPYYLFEFDGDHLLTFDLSEEEPKGEITSDLIRGIRRLCTLPEVWKSRQTPIASMHQYLHTLLDLVEQEGTAA